MIRALLLSGVAVVVATEHKLHAATKEAHHHHHHHRVLRGDSDMDPAITQQVRWSPTEEQKMHEQQVKLAESAKHTHETAVEYEAKARQLEGQAKEHRADDEEGSEYMLKEAVRYAAAARELMHRAKRQREELQAMVLADHQGLQAAQPEEGDGIETTEMSVAPEVESNSIARPRRPDCKDSCDTNTQCLVECRVCEYSCDQHDATDTFSTINKCSKSCRATMLRDYGTKAAQRKWAAHRGSPKFEDFDSDGDGKIVQSEAFALGDNLGVNEDELKDIVEAADQNGDGAIDRKEWDAAGDAPSNHKAPVEAVAVPPPAPVDHWVPYPIVNFRAVAASEVAKMDFQFNNMDADHDGQVSRAEIQSYMNRWSHDVEAKALNYFDASDADHDGFLTQQEFGDAPAPERVAFSRQEGGSDVQSRQAKGAVCEDKVLHLSPELRSALLRDFDRDGDGCVTAQELLASPSFQQLDKDGDGVISLPEAQSFGAELGVNPDRMEKLVQEADLDHDGFVTQAEFSQGELGGGSAPAPTPAPQAEVELSAVEPLPQALPESSSAVAAELTDEDPLAEFKEAPVHLDDNADLPADAPQMLLQLRHGEKRGRPTLRK